MGFVGDMQGWHGKKKGSAEQDGLVFDEARLESETGSLWIGLDGEVEPGIVDSVVGWMGGLFGGEKKVVEG